MDLTTRSVVFIINVKNIRVTMSERQRFPRVAPKKLMDLYQIGLLINGPKQMCTMLVPYKGKLCSVPIEVMRIIYRQMGEALAKADRVNEYKMQHGYNPGVNEPV